MHHPPPQTYFMSLFFFLSGLYVPGSYRRKGAAQFLLDRTLRLVIPCLVYSLLAPPFLDWWAQCAKNPAVAPSIANSFKVWLAPGWPTKYVLPTGPPWFVWMLWCFNVAYVVLATIGRSRAGKWFRRSCLSCCADFSKAVGGGSAPALPRDRRGAPEFTTKQVMLGGGGLALLLFTLMYAARVLDILAFNIRPAAFYQRGPFVTFMPDYFPVYVVTFALGIVSRPDSLARIPTRNGWATWCLMCSGVWWVLLGFIPSTVLAADMGLKKGMSQFLLSWLLRTFVEQTFAVTWSLGLLMWFKGAYNFKPGPVGRQLIGGAYAAYIVHMVVIPLFARALMPFRFPSGVIYALAISPMAVITSWVVAMGLRAIPGADRIL